MKPAWTRLALADLNNARAYIADENPSAAVRVVERIEKTVDALRRHPESAARAGSAAPVSCHQEPIAASRTTMVWPSSTANAGRHLTAASTSSRAAA